MNIKVVIPCHNYGRFLAECVESVMNQSYPAKEVLIVNDSSFDDTHAISMKIIQYNQSLKSSTIITYGVVGYRSVWGTRKYGSILGYKKSDITCFLDADDKLPPDYFEKGLPLFADPDVQIVYSDMQEFGLSDNYIRQIDYIPGHIETANYIHSGALVRSSVLHDAFNAPPPEDEAIADWYLWRRILAQNPAYKAARQEAVYLYRRHGKNMTWREGE